jgi:hypothetical protein
MRASLADSGPRVITVTSPLPWRSFILMASSMAYSSNGFITQDSPVVSIKGGLGEGLGAASVEGTCFIQTTIFTG